MYRLTAAALLCAIPLAVMSQPASDSGSGDKSWIDRSNVYTNLVLDVQLEHSPEDGSQEGLAKFDSRISNPTLSDELAERRELEAVVAKLTAAQTTETDKRVREDLEILRKALDLRFRQDDFGIQHEVPFLNARVCAACSMIRWPPTGDPPRSSGCANIQERNPDISRSRSC